jgi:hypothetical protein
MDLEHMECLMSVTYSNKGDMEQLLELILTEA